ncbi:unnamed protein product [Haemophilus parainfluenzae T3T1]|uniref:Uncharacterized protein n=1 Tax=Haemophilus parainfluenzae (strain T3T1) TaxID=862965 RepID=A0AB33QMN4_HAEP3|nr:unnamed protein product [Haemophilus parainfluenzae T3T1]
MSLTHNLLYRSHVHNHLPYVPQLAHDELKYAQSHQEYGLHHKYPIRHRLDNQINTQRLRHAKTEPPFPHRIISSYFTPKTDRTFICYDSCQNNGTIIPKENNLSSIAKV